MTPLIDEPELGTGRLHLDLVRRLAAEALGTAFLIIAVIGSLVFDVIAFQRARVPYVGDVELPAGDDDDAAPRER